MLTTSLVSFLLVDLSGTRPTVGAVSAFAAAVTQNNFLNRMWTFSGEPGLFRLKRREDGAAKSAVFVQYVKLVGVSRRALAVNLVVLNLALKTAAIQFKTVANLIRVAAGMPVNFAGYRVRIFRYRGNR